ITSGATSVSTGSNFACATLGSGDVMCWGSNEFGQLGNNSTTASSTPVPVSLLGSAGYGDGGASNAIMVTPSSIAVVDPACGLAAQGSATIANIGTSDAIMVTPSSIAVVDP